MQVMRRRGGLVRKEGVEPPRPFGHKILSYPLTRFFPDNSHFFGNYAGTMPAVCFLRSSVVAPGFAAATAMLARTDDAFSSYTSSQQYDGTLVWEGSASMVDERIIGYQLCTFCKAKGYKEPTGQKCEVCKGTGKMPIYEKKN
jgi:hypothetical protein